MADWIRVPLSGVGRSAIFAMRGGDALFPNYFVEDLFLTIQHTA